MVNTLPNNSFQSFIESRKAMGLTPRALGNYLDRLYRALEAIGNPYSATYAIIQSYLNTIPPHEERLYNRLSHYKVLKTFYRWLDKVYDFPNPMRKMEAPKIGKFILPILEEETVASITLPPTYLGSDVTSRQAFVGLDTGANTGGLFRLNDSTNTNMLPFTDIYSVNYDGYNVTNLIAGGANNHIYYSDNPGTSTSSVAVSNTGLSSGINRVNVAWVGGNVIAGTSAP